MISTVFDYEVSCADFDFSSNGETVSKAVAVWLDAEKDIDSAQQFADIQRYIEGQERRVMSAEKEMNRALESLRTLGNSVNHFFREMGDTLNSTDLTETALNEIAYNSSSHDRIVSFIEEDTTVRGMMTEYADGACENCEARYCENGCDYQTACAEAMSKVTDTIWDMEHTSDISFKDIREALEDIEREVNV